MRALLASCTLILFVFILGCETGNNDSSAVSAQIIWTQDVSSINMAEVGVAESKISQNSVHELKSGKGTIYWISEGVEYSKTVDIGNMDEGDDDDVECEQEGEHEGENEGCLFSFKFTGENLSISK